MLRLRIFDHACDRITTTKPESTYAPIRCCLVTDGPCIRGDKEFSAPFFPRSIKSHGPNVGSYVKSGFPYSFCSLPRSLSPTFVLSRVAFSETASHSLSENILHTLAYSHYFTQLQSLALWYEEMRFSAFPMLPRALDHTPDRTSSNLDRSHSEISQDATAGLEDPDPR